MEYWSMNAADETFFDGVVSDSKIEDQPMAKQNGEKENNGNSASVKVKKIKPKPCNMSGNDGNGSQSEWQSDSRSRFSVRIPLKTLNNGNEAEKKVDDEKVTSGVGAVSSNNYFEENKKPEEKVPKIIVYEDNQSSMIVGEENNQTVKHAPNADSRSSEKRRRSIFSPVTSTTQQPSSLSDSLIVKSVKKEKKSPSSSPVKTKNDTKKTKSASAAKKSPKVSIKSSSKTPTKVSTKNNESSRKSSKLAGEDLQEKMAKLENIFPNVSPIYLKSHCIRLNGSVEETVDYVIHKERSGKIPARADYIATLEAEKIQNDFLNYFSPENFIKYFSDPWRYFLSQEKRNFPLYVDHSLYYLKNKFKKHCMNTIEEVFHKNDKSLYLTNKALMKKNRNFRMRATNRSKGECEANRPVGLNLQFLLEVAFIENEKKIKSRLKKQETAKIVKVKEAEEAGSLLTCECCSKSSLIEEDVVTCPSGHLFCKDCVIESVEAEMRKDKFQFKCLANCEQAFSIKALQNVILPEVLAVALKRAQVEEIKAAGIDDLVFCPYCLYAAILPPEFAILKCLNPTCMKETCRHCKELNHIPLKCNEVEKAEEKKEETTKEAKSQGKKSSDCKGRKSCRIKSNQSKGN